MIIESALLLTLANECQNNLPSNIITRLIEIESANNPYALAVKGVPIFNQADNLNDAITSAKKLDSLGFNFSAGLMQINHTNFNKTGLTIETVFDSCKNIQAGSQLFKDCFDRAKITYPNKTEHQQLEHAASCYYSGNFTTGFKKEGKNNISYIDKFNQLDTSHPTPTSVKLHRMQQEKITHTQDNDSHVESWDVFSDFAN